MGYDVAEGTNVLVNAYAIATDKKLWGDNAEEFKPERGSGTTTLNTIKGLSTSSSPLVPAAGAARATSSPQPPWSSPLPASSTTLTGRFPMEGPLPSNPQNTPRMLAI
jgi:hypothetical protein